MTLLTGCAQQKTNGVNIEKNAYENKEYGFKFEYPSNWKIEEKVINEKGNDSLELKIYNSNNKSYRELNINIASMEPSLIDFSDHDTLFQGFDYEKYKKQSKLSSISIDNMETFERKERKDMSYCKFFGLYCEYPYLFELLTKNGNNYYRFAFSGNFAKDKDNISIKGTEFESILSSFKFIK